MKIKKAVIPAAGLGTRVLPASKSMPKEMLPIVDKPAIQYIVEEAVHSGIEDILIITSRGKTTVEDHFDRNPELEARLLASKKQEVYDEMVAISQMANIQYVRQKETKGLGHAVLCAKAFVGNEPFAVLKKAALKTAPQVAYLWPVVALAALPEASSSRPAGKTRIPPARKAAPRML